MSVELLGLPRTLGRYELVRVLGRGGMGRVVLAHDPVLRRDVALKLVEPAAVEAESLAELRYLFHREARATAALRHPNIVEVFDYSGPEAEVPFLACELIDGPLLRDVLEAKKRLPAHLVAALGYELVQALEEAHAHSVIHRDVKPDNVFWTAAGRVVLADFGVAKALDGVRLGGTVEFGATSLYGSPSYMAPEQVDGRGALPASDIFALGALLFEALAGGAAFDGDEVESILEAIGAGRRAEMPAGLSIPPRLERLVDSMLAPRVEDRPEARRVREELRVILDALGVSDPRLVLKEHGAAARPRSRRRWPIVAVLLAACAVGGLWAYGRRANTVVVRLHLTEPGVVLVDGATLGRYAGDARVELTAGRHMLELVRGEERTRREVLLVSGSEPVFDF